ncbi:MAG TPA: hypothetical protein VEY11_14585 [Pyrinomonadaceae bacterium]|nr:hypothetical protein [Pyrinomonadaceae bacterium]
MRKKQHQDKCKCCAGETGCGHVATERNRYFTGKFMAARDFQDEQTYFLSRHRLHNRLLHGWGIVCGLKVTHHPDYRRNPDSACARRWVVVHPGIALDCCGRELVVKREIAFELPLPRVPENDEQHAPPQKQYRPPEYDAEYAEEEDDAGESAADGDADDEVMRAPFLLALRYTEEEIERVPALYHEGNCDPARTEANRVRECAEVVVVPLDEVEGNCWRNSEGDPNARCRDDCADDLYAIGGSCLDPVCPCKEFVPLALIRFDPERPEQGFEIDHTGRRYLPAPPELLTHIVDINWPHGGELTLDQLNNELNGELVITFDRKLLPAVADATGINAFTFTVQYGGVQRTLEFLPYAEGSEPRLDEECRAVFTIDPDYINTDKPADRKQVRPYNILGSIIYVTLRCDFILDCHNNPVDGNFLRGLLPTGDGVPGGVFESWFRVVYEKEEEKRWQQQRGA